MGVSLDFWTAGRHFWPITGWSVSGFGLGGIFLGAAIWYFLYSEQGLVEFSPYGWLSAGLFLFVGFGDLGLAAAYYVESTIKPYEIIGISSWSSNLLALVDAMHQVLRKPGVQVVQILGGAVGDVLLHFFDDKGQPIETSLNRRVVSMTLPQLRSVDRAVGVAGGRRKHEAILGALLGGLINVLITDCYTARRLMDEALS